MTDARVLLVNIDRTLTDAKSGKPFKQTPDDILPIQGTQSAIKYFHNRGFQIFGISNQGGCDTINPITKKPYKTISDTVAEMRNTLALFPELDSVYFCPSMKGEGCMRVTREVSFLVTSDFWQGLYRKPDIGMVNEIEWLLQGLNRLESLFVGDRDEDKQCAANAGIPFMDALRWRNKYGKK